MVATHYPAAVRSPKSVEAKVYRQSIQILEESLFEHGIWTNEVGYSAGVCVEYNRGTGRFSSVVALWEGGALKFLEAVPAATKSMIRLHSSMIGGLSS